MKLIQRAKEVRNKEGVQTLVTKGIGYIYSATLRPVLPKQTRVYEYNGIKVPADTPILDPFIPPHSHGRWLQDRPEHEQTEIKQLREHCTPGDDVVIVGGGYGISAVVAAKAVGESGSVMIYEANSDLVDQINNIVEYNGVEKIVTCCHAIVGELVSLEWAEGSQTGAETIKPEDLPLGDIYELDCEGAEKEILSKMSSRPETLVVETHAIYEVPKEVTIPIMKNKGYNIQNVIPNGDGSHVVVAEQARNNT
jgi:hypothetical protein